MPLPAGVVPPPDLARRYTSLGIAERLHLERLMATWNLLSDFSFSDLLLFVEITRDGGDGGGEGESDDVERSGATAGPNNAPPPPGDGSLTTGGEPKETGAPDESLAFVVLGQMRPTTSQTLYETDLVGQMQPAENLSIIAEAYRTGAIARGEQPSLVAEGPVRISCIPVRHDAAVIAVLCRVWSPRTTRRRGALERVYLDLFERLSLMITDGLFPFADDDAAIEEAPRVGDGVLVVDAKAKITYASPNAVNALHRASITSSIVGSNLTALGLDTSAVDEAFATRMPVIEEIERRPDVILLVRCIPLIARGEVTGAALLVHDVTDLRHRDRLLLTKDATIREVHHRVKNNLQTISSLLRLQARRLDDDESKGRTALLEAERRIRAIALVHDILAREATEQVPFDEIVSALVDMTRETNTPEQPVSMDVDGSLGDVPAEVATPLAVVVAELLQNAVEHAFLEPPAHAASAQIQLVLRSEPDHLRVEVRDNGCGLPEGFDIDRTRSLGLSIVRDLVRSQLGGTITMATESGAVVTLEVPVRRRGSG